MAKGKFITLEGGEGTGKTTQARLLADRLRRAGHEIVLTREPGGSEKAEEIREVLLAGRALEYGPFAEALLFSVAREDHLETKIRPALADGAWVVCDRFTDSTRAYQGASGLRPAVIQALERLIVGPSMPDLTLILDLAVDEGLRRAAARASGNGGAGRSDRYEAMEVAFHEDLRRAFRSIAEKNPARCTMIDAQQSEASVADEIWKAVVEALHP